MNVFLTGATGYIGSVIAEKLQAAGHSVVGLARNEATAEKLAKRHIKPFLGDLQHPERWANAARQTVAGSGKPFIATSDTSILGDTGSEIVDENHPIATGFFLAERAKAEAAVVRASQQTIRSVVLRLPLYIYGRGGGTSYVPMRLQEAQEIGVARYIAPGEHQVSAVHVDDVAQLYVLALEKAPAGSIFHAATESGIAEKSIAETISRVVDCKTEGISLEQATLKWGRGIAAFFSINNQISANKAMEQLGWHPQATLSLLDDIVLTNRLAA